MDAELVDAGTLAGTRHTADAHAHAVSRIGKALLDDFLRHLLMLGHGALHQGDGLTKDGDVPLEDALHVVRRGETAASEASALQIGIDTADGCHAAIHGTACIFGIVLGMFHNVRVLRVNAT